MQEALERADLAAADAARRALVDFLRQQARSIRDKYVEPPQTTDFAILFLPTEGLYAEMLARPGLADALQREYRVMLAGPMSLWALLNSLQMGFRTLAIEQRSSEVWRVLGAVKTEFRKFGDVLSKTKERIDKASEELEKAGVRRRVLERQLRSVDELPEQDAVRLIGTEGAFDAGEGRRRKNSVAEGRRTVFDTIRKWREQRVLRTAALPDELWNDAVAALPFLAGYTDDELARLRDLRRAVPVGEEHRRGARPRRYADAAH